MTPPSRCKPFLRAPRRALRALHRTPKMSSKEPTEVSGKGWGGDAEWGGNMGGWGTRRGH